jgi:hypothetical protein
MFMNIFHENTDALFYYDGISVFSLSLSHNDRWEMRCKRLGTTEVHKLYALLEGRDKILD